MLCSQKGDLEKRTASITPHSTQTAEPGQSQGWLAPCPALPSAPQLAPGACVYTLIRWARPPSCCWSPLSTTFLHKARVFWACPAYPGLGPSIPGQQLEAPWE